MNPFRGNVMLSDLVLPGFKVMPTLHPDTVRREWKMLPIVVGDFIRAQAECVTPEIIYPDVKLMTEPTEAEVRDYLIDVCMKSDLLSVDIETAWNMITCIGFAPNPREAMCIPFLDRRKGNKSYWPDAITEFRVWKRIASVLESPVPKVFQNGPYDIAWLYKTRGISVMNYRHDTRLMHHALYPELPKTLAFMGSNYTNLGAWKHWGGTYEREKRDE
jgi:hypothetical protein